MFEELASDLVSTLGLELSPIGFHYSKDKPPGALDLARGNACLASAVLSCGKGRSIAVGPQTCGRACAAYHLGFSETIFQGVEHFLSCGPSPGREPERFVRTSEQAQRFIEGMRLQAPSDTLAVFKPLAQFDADAPPLVVIFLAAPDQMSALVYLLHFDAPEADTRVVARFASACGSMVTLPLRALQAGEPRAYWGFHDPYARVHVARNLTSLSMPFSLLQEAWSHAHESFLVTENWKRLRQRSAGAREEEQ